uniref:Uncharacterized protein n=1 Tax=Molossus molossus TaxID=27622 RepID=A0A7J8J053_MOLMO|nr:hypothetical protein HJG59_010252 [Molossus molossus]
MPGPLGDTSAEAGGRLAGGWPGAVSPGARWVLPPLLATSLGHIRRAFQGRQGPVLGGPATCSFSAGSSWVKGTISEKCTFALRTVQTPAFCGLKEKSDWALTECPRSWQEPASLCRPTCPAQGHRVRSRGGKPKSGPRIEGRRQRVRESDVQPLGYGLDGGRECPSFWTQRLVHIVKESTTCHRMTLKQGTCASRERERLACSCHIEKHSAWTQVTSRLSSGHRREESPAGSQGPGHRHCREDEILTRGERCRWKWSCSQVPPGKASGHCTRPVRCCPLSPARPPSSRETQASSHPDTSPLHKQSAHCKPRFAALRVSLVPC